VQCAFVLAGDGPVEDSATLVDWIEF